MVKKWEKRIKKVEARLWLQSAALGRPPLARHPAGTSAPLSNPSLSRSTHAQRVGAARGDAQA